MRRRALQPLKFHYISRNHPKAHEFTNHILHQASARSAVAGSARNCLAQVVRDSAGVTDGNQRKLAEDTLNGNDVQDRFLVVKLVYHPRAK